jgi:hypothetical protein
MIENVVAYFYPQDLDSVHRAPMLLGMLLMRSREIIISNMSKASGLTLGIRKSLYHRADLDAVGEGFMATCIEEEANKLVEDSTEIATWVIEILLIDMS